MAVKKKPKKKTTTLKKKRSLKLSKQNKIILGSLLMLLGIALFIAFVSFFFNWQDDHSTIASFNDRNVETKNWMSKFGANISYYAIYKGFGIASFILVGLLFTTGLYLFSSIPLKKLNKNWFWGLIIMIWVSMLMGFAAKTEPLLGGVFGYEMNDFLKDYIGTPGIVLLLTFGLVSYLVVRFGLTPESIVSFFQKTKKEIIHDFQEEKSAASTTTSVTKEALKTDETKKEVVFDATNDATVYDSFKEKEKKASLETPISVTTIKKETEEVAIEVEKVVEEKTVKTNQADKLVKEFGEFDPKLDLSNYKFPTLELLKDYNAGGGITINQEELEENKNRIVETLKNYKIGISQIKATIGPTVTLYEIVPEAGVRISKIKNLEDDIALSLSALGIRIIAPIPGKGTIGIEVPNKNSTIVSMRSVIASPKFQGAEMELPVALGKTISNETLVVDLAKMPHLLMAGATGQGKSVGLNAVLTSLLYKKHPAEVKFVLVDPKKVELTLFNKIERHYLAKLPDSEEAIITDNTKVINTLNSLCIEMDNRYELLKSALCRNIKEYNQKFKARKLNPNDGHQFLPYIVLVVDEFADLIMTAGKEVETPIARLAQLARAIGIHLIIATQRPSVNVITGIIKANFPARIAFRVTSKIDSRTILDSGGADQLIGRGDMLYTSGNELTRIQCAFVDTPEVERICDFIGAQRAYPDAHILPEYVGEESGTSLDIDISDRDALFREAAEVIVTAQQGSASLLQRKLKLGYNRAGRIIDQLEAAGVVGPFEGSKARQVLVPDFVALDQLLKNESDLN